MGSNLPVWQTSETRALIDLSFKLEQCEQLANLYALRSSQVVAKRCQALLRKDARRTLFEFDSPFQRRNRASPLSALRHFPTCPVA